MGRDIVATRSLGESKWDNYQCKHYNHPLWPSDVWLELGKLVYYTYIGAFPYPSAYFFVTPRGLGTTLSNLLKNADRLKSELIEHWDQHCREEITTTGAIFLDRDLRAYLEGLDFSVIGSVPPLQLLEQHAATPWHVARFGGTLPARPQPPEPPAEPGPNEAGYLAQLLTAYADHLGKTVHTATDLGGGKIYRIISTKHGGSSTARNLSANSPETLFHRVLLKLYRTMFTVAFVMSYVGTIRMVILACWPS